jgi:hypothetical protein
MLKYDRLDLQTPQIRLLEIISCPDDVSQSVRFKHLDLNEPVISYTVLATCLENHDESSKNVTPEGTEIQIVPPIRDALRCVTEGKPYLIWIQQVCINYVDASETARQMELLKSIHVKAKGVIIWAGGIQEPCVLETYLGVNTQAYVEHAFEFAKALSECSVSNIYPLIKESFSEPQLSWYFLLRILYRPWFRNTPVLRTKYIDSLLSATVQCGNVSIPWYQLFKAAERLRIANPSPTYLMNVSSTRDMQQDTLWRADINWFKATLNFGTRLELLLAHVFFLGRKYKGTKQEDRITILVGVLAEKYDFEGSISWIANAVKHMLDPETGDEKVEDVALERLRPRASLPFQGRLIPTPVPSDQAPFVHTAINRGRNITLALLLPHEGNLLSPVQIGIVHARIDALPPFAFVRNTALLQTRQTAHILANGQSMQIPKILEVFLRRFRDEKEGKHLFVWQMCMYEDEIKIEKRSQVEGYTAAKHFMARYQKEEIDMYRVLDDADGNGMDAITEGATWDDWLLKLNE